MLIRDLLTALHPHASQRHALAAALRDEDALHATTTGEATHAGGRCVGMCRLSRPGYHDILLPILLDDAYYVTTRGPLADAVAQATLIRTVDEDLFITVNHVWRRLALGDDVTLAEGIIAHEAGHVLAQHFALPYSGPLLHTMPMPATDTPLDSVEDWLVFTDGLIDGGVFPRELEADRYGAALTDWPTMLHVRQYCTQTSGLLGVRWENHNRLTHHTTHMHEDGYTPTLDGVLFSLTTLTDLEIRQLVDDPTNPPHPEDPDDVTDPALHTGSALL